MSYKKIVALAMALVMVLALSACATTPEVTPAPTVSAQPTQGADGDPQATPSDATPAPQSNYDEHMTISISVTDAEKSGNTPKNEFFNNKFNVEFKYIPVTWGDWMEKVRAWVATDDMPDLLWWDMKLNNTVEYRSWAQQGAFKEIPQDLSRWPELAALREKLVSDDKMLTVDGALYGWPAYRNNPDWLDNAYYSMMVYRRDWAKAVGMYKEGDVYTWDEVKAMIDAIKEQDPGNNGVGNTFGITSETWALPNVFMDLLGGMENNFGYIKKDGQWTTTISQPEFLPTLQFAADLYRDGYIWKDQLVVSGSEGADNFYSGRSAFFLGNVQPDWLNTCYQKMMDSDMIQSTDQVAPAIVLSPFDNETFWLTQTEDYWTVTCMNHNMTDAMQERILDMWNWLASEEGRRFYTIGVEGTDYTLNEDGTVNVLWEKDATGAYISPYVDHVFNEYTPSGLVVGPNAVSRQDGYNEFENVFDFVKTSPDYRVHPLDWDVNTFSAPNYDQYGDFSSDVKAKIIEIFGSSEDVTTMWNAFLEEISPKMQLVVDELNANLK